MVPGYTWILYVLSVVTLPNVLLCEGQFLNFKNIDNFEMASSTPLPFPACRADNIECLRRGLRTFFFLMDMGHSDMKPIDPIILNSITVALPNEQIAFLMRRVNVTGAKWSKLADRKFNLPGEKNGVIFTSNLHVTGEITMNMAGRINPYIAHITMDLYEIESNITYAVTGQKGYDNEDYIIIGPERIAVRNTRLPTFFLQPETEDSYRMEQVLLARQPIIDHIANEITIALMHSLVDNFRVFASKVPVRNYYTYNK